jgi:hypothetical protein
MMIPRPETLAAILADVAATEIMPRFRNLAATDIREKSAGDIAAVEMAFMVEVVVDRG